METPPDLTTASRCSRVWPVIALGLLATGWGTFFLTLGYSSRLAVRWGPAPDVVDALGRDAYIGRHTLPYHSVVLLLDLLTAGALAVPSRRGWPLFLKVVAGVLLVPSALLHGLAWLVTGLFAC